MGESAPSRTIWSRDRQMLAAPCPKALVRVLDAGGLDLLVAVSGGATFVEISVDQADLLTAVSDSKVEASSVWRHRPRRSGALSFLSVHVIPRSGRPFRVDHRPLLRGPASRSPIA